MVYNYSTKNGLGKGRNVDGEFQGEMEHGTGTPAHSAPQGTVYVDLNATIGTSSHFRNTDGAGTWAVMSDD